MASPREFIAEIARATDPAHALLIAGSYAIEHAPDLARVLGVFDTLADKLTAEAQRRSRTIADLAEEAKFGPEVPKRPRTGIHDP